MLYKKPVLKKFAIFIGKRLCLESHSRQLPPRGSVTAKLPEILLKGGPVTFWFDKGGTEGFFHVWVGVGGESGGVQGGVEIIFDGGCTA